MSESNALHNRPHFRQPPPKKKKNHTEDCWVCDGQNSLDDSPKRTSSFPYKLAQTVPETNILKNTTNKKKPRFATPNNDFV